MELVKISIRGTEYPACFSLRTAMNAAEKFGSLDALFEERPLHKAAEANLWLLDQCLAAGKLYAELEGEKTPDPPPIDSLFDSLSISDVGRAFALIMDAAQKTTVELQSDSKNAAAT